MPHISKKELSKREFEELFGHLVKYVHRQDTRRDKEIFFFQFLTETEKIMLAKRLAIIVLLDRGVSPYEIWNKLGVSPSTVARISEKLDRGGYRKIARSAKKSTDLDDLLKWLVYVGGLMPPRVGSRAEWRKYRKEKLGF